MHRTVVPALASLLLSLALVACGGGPSGSGGPTPRPDPGGALGALLPATLAGQPVVIAEANGEQAAALFPTGDGGLLAEEMDGLNMDMSDFEVAAGIHPAGTVGVFRVTGLHWTPGSSQMARLVTTMLGPVGRLHVTSPTIAGKRVFKINDRDNPDYIAYAWISGQRETGDNVFFARGDEAFLEEFFGAVR